MSASKDDKGTQHQAKSDTAKADTAKSDTAKAAETSPTSDAQPLSEGMTDVDARIHAARNKAVEESNAATRQADNTARREEQGDRRPTMKELAELKKAHFGDKPGAVQIDTDLATGKTKLIYVDGDGKVTDGGTFKPKKESR
jgi:hypothetical protein